MILQALNRYYDRKATDPESNIAPPGWEWKELPFLIILDEEGLPVSLEDTREMIGKKMRAKSFLVPQSVKRAMGILPNLFWDNVEYAIGIPCKGKPARIRQQHEAFLARIKPHENIQTVGVVLSFLKREDREALLAVFPEWAEMRETCAFLSFKLAGALEPIFRGQEIVKWISHEAEDGGEEKEQALCLVVGELDEPARLHPSIKGVQGAEHHRWKYCLI